MWDTEAVRGTWGGDHRGFGSKTKGMARLTVAENHRRGRQIRIQIQELWSFMRRLKNQGLMMRQIKSTRFGSNSNDNRFSFDDG